MLTIPDDKLGHINLGLLIGLAFADYPFAAILIFTVVAFGKELFDYVASKWFAKPHSVELLDAVATIGGGVLGVLIHQSIDFIFLLLS